MAKFWSGKPDTADGAVDPLAPWFAREYVETSFWANLAPGPSVDSLAPRVSSIPQSFFDDRVDLRALAGDVLLAPLTPGLTALLADCSATDASRRGAAVALWLFASEAIVEPVTPPLSRAWAERAIAILALRLAPVVDPGEWLVVAERREEAVRAFLLGCAQLPAGEDVETATSLWERHDSLRRNSALAASLTDHQHRLNVLTILKAKRAAEAAARYGHE